MIYIKNATILLFYLCVGIYSQSVPSEIKDFSYVMLKEGVRLCRTANICETNVSESTVAREKQRNIVSCCQDCSCDDRCGNRGDCCFPTSGDQASLLDARKFQECTAPLTSELLPTEYYKHKFYYMTTVCPTGKVVSQYESGEHCGSARVAPWGSLLPIYSKSTGRIYKNPACADCHGVRDGVMWMALMDCKEADSSNARYISVAENFEWLSRNSLQENCQVRFQVQQPLETERCFRDIIDSCNDTQVVVPEWSEMKEEQIVSACHSGIVAPFQYHKAYANVFCFLCNGGKSTDAEYCFSKDTDPLGKPRAFTCLLDTGTLESATRLDIREETRRPLACMKQENQEDSCVFLHCPSGKVYNKNFQCVHLASTWNIPFYHVALRLRFANSDRISISVLMNLLQSAHEVSTWFLCPWPKWWSVNSLHFETNNGTIESGYVESFIIYLKMRPRRKDHQSVLHEIRRQMRKTWTIKAPQTNISLSADFLEYTTISLLYLRNTQPQAVPTWYDRALKNQQTHGIPFFRENSVQSIIQRKDYLQITGQINRMNFCKQISLGANASDYDVMADNTLLSYNGTIFFDAEFELISTEDGALDPRICLGDSEYKEQLFARSNSSQTSSILFEVLVAAMLLLHLLCLVVTELLFLSSSPCI